MALSRVRWSNRVEALVCEPPLQIGEAQFRQRAAQILNSYPQPEPGQRHSYLQKLVRGIPARLAKCKKNKFGRCGK